MNKKLTIRLGGSLIEVSEDGTSPLSDPKLLYDLKQRLSFTKIIFNYANKKEKTFERVALYAFDDLGRLVCQKGWLDFILYLASQHNYQTQIIDERKEPPGNPYQENWDDVINSFSFRPLQKECLAYIAARIRQRKGGVIEAVPAFGKSKLISAVCALYPKATIDVITFGNDLVYDLRRHILQHRADVGYVCGGHRSIDNVTVFSALSMAYIRPEAHLVLVDEVHRLMTDRGVAELSKYYDSCMFGFTATKETRADNAHKRMEGLFGPTIYNVSWTEAIQYGLITPISVEWREIVRGPQVSKFYNSQIKRKRYAYWRNKTRNSAIAEAAREYYNQGLQTLILVETVEHLLHLHQLLPEFSICFSERISETREKQLKAIFPKAKLRLSKSERATLKSDFEQRNILGAIATSIWATGVSFDGLQVLIRADGGASETNNIQWPGRVARISTDTGKEVGIVVDFMDRFDAWAYQRSKFRQRSYSRNGWEQTNVSNKAISSD